MQINFIVWYIAKHKTFHPIDPLNRYLNIINNNQYIILIRKQLQHIVMFIE